MIIKTIKKLLASLRLCVRPSSFAHLSSLLSAASIVEFVISLIFGGFDHSASKIHGQGAINHKKLLKLYNKMPIRNPVTSRVHVHLFCRALNENWGRYLEK